MKPVVSHITINLVFWIPKFILLYSRALLIKNNERFVVVRWFRSKNSLNRNPNHKWRSEGFVMTLLKARTTNRSPSINWLLSIVGWKLIIVNQLILFLYYHYLHKSRLNKFSNLILHEAFHFDKWKFFVTIPKLSL